MEIVIYILNLDLNDERCLQKAYKNPVLNY